MVRFVMFLVCVGREVLHSILSRNQQQTIQKLNNKNAYGIYFGSFASKNASSALCLGESPPDNLLSNLSSYNGLGINQYMCTVQQKDELVPDKNKNYFCTYVCMSRSSSANQRLLVVYL